MFEYKWIFAKNKGGILVEAAILFPIIIMIFLAIILLSFYLPIRTALQNGTQIAASTIAAEMSDTWLYHDKTNYTNAFHTDPKKLSNVYVELIKKECLNNQKKAESLVKKSEKKLVITPKGKLDVNYSLESGFSCKKVRVDAIRQFNVPVNFSFIGFPTTISIDVSSTAFVNNSDEFVRNIDIAVDLITILSDKFELDKLFEGVGHFSRKFIR